ncbi:MAG: hypothetical protein QW076_03215 [Candidatus Anstonellales archaeon]
MHTTCQTCQTCQHISISDGSDGTSTCVGGFATENTHQNAIKLNTFEAKETPGHADIPSLPSPILSQG